jgi:outer membrane lipoprotein-sorting protein
VNTSSGLSGRPRARSLRLALAVAGLVLVSGCAATKPRKTASVPTGNAPTVRRVLEVLDSRDDALASFRAQARLDYRSPEQSFRSTQVVVVRAPASARIEVMNPFGISYTVATDGKVLSAFDRRQRVFYQGSAQAESFRRFTGIPLAANELAAVLRGLPPAIGEMRWAAVQPTAGGWLMQRRLSGGGLQQVVVDSSSLIPLSVKITGDRERHDVEVKYSDYRDVSGVVVPFRIEVSFRDGSFLELVYKSVQRDVTLSEGAFRIDRPAGARLVRIDTEGAVAR